MTRQESLKRVQVEYERLRADNPDVPHAELWRRAEDTVAVQIRSLGDPRLSRVGLVGVLLVSTATLMVLASFSLILSSGRNTEGWVLLMWVGSSLLGAVALGLLVAARANIERSRGLVTGEGLVNAGFVFAAAGGTASFLLFGLAGMMSSGL